MSNLFNNRWANIAAMVALASLVGLGRVEADQLFLSENAPIYVASAAGDKCPNITLQGKKFHTTVCAKNKGDAISKSFGVFGGSCGCVGTCVTHGEVCQLINSKISGKGIKLTALPIGNAIGCPEGEENFSITITGRITLKCFCECRGGCSKTAALPPCFKCKDGKNVPDDSEDPGICKKCQGGQEVDDDSEDPGQCLKCEGGQEVADDSESCSDGDLCTNPDYCSGGTCTGTPSVPSCPPPVSPHFLVPTDPCCR